jgi:hypothetical protein
VKLSTNVHLVSWCEWSYACTHPIYPHSVDRDKFNFLPFFRSMARQPLAGQDLLIFEASRLYHTRSNYSGRVISPSQRLLTANTQHLQGTDIHASGGIRTLSPNKRAAAHPHLRPRGHQDRHLLLLPLTFLTVVLLVVRVMRK